MNLKTTFNKGVEQKNDRQFRDDRPTIMRKSSSPVPPAIAVPLPLLLLTEGEPGGVIDLTSQIGGQKCLQFRASILGNGVVKNFGFAVGGEKPNEPPIFVNRSRVDERNPHRFQQLGFHAIARSFTASNFPTN